MYRTYALLYRLRLTPWDQSAIPGPVVEAARATARGVAVDLGCGTGAQARHLAGLGWSVTAIDFIPAAVAAARRRDRGATVTWRVGDVTVPASVDPDGELASRVGLILDNGCVHGIEARLLPGWSATVNQLASADAVLLVRAAPRTRGRRIGPQGIDADELTAAVGPGWTGPTRPEPGWYRYQRGR
jgi:SAM-dependent methyltransferase